MLSALPQGKKEEDDMKRFSGLLAVAAIVAFVPSFAAAQIETAHYFGHAYYDVATGKISWNEPPSGRFVGSVYNNAPLISPAAANAGISAPAADGPVFGDRMTTLGTGTLSTHSFTVFNSTGGGNTGQLDAAEIELRFYNYDGTNLPGTGGSTLLGGYLSGEIDFTDGGNDPTGLPAGYYTVLSFINLETLAIPINLSSTSIYVTQQIGSQSYSGTTTRLGIVSANPLLAGTTSPDSIYVSGASNVGAGAPGMYLFGNPAIVANVGYEIGVVPEPATMALLGLGLAAFARRRR